MPKEATKPKSKRRESDPDRQKRGRQTREAELAADEEERKAAQGLVRLRKPSEKSKKRAAEEPTTTAKKATGKKRRGAKKAAAALEASDSDDEEEDDSPVPSDSDGEDANGEEGNEDDDDDAEENALDAALEKQHFIKVKLVYPPAPLVAATFSKSALEVEVLLGWNDLLRKKDESDSEPGSDGTDDGADEPKSLERRVEMAIIRLANREPASLPANLDPTQGGACILFCLAVRFLALICALL